MNLKKQNVIKELNLEVNKSIMDQILVLSNDRFRQIFALEDNNLYEGLSTKMFELFMFSKIKTMGDDDYEVLDTANQKIDKKEGLS